MMNISENNSKISQNQALKIRVKNALCMLINGFFHSLDACSLTLYREEQVTVYSPLENMLNLTAEKYSNSEQFY